MSGPLWKCFLRFPTFLQSLSCLRGTQEGPGIFLAIVSTSFLCNLGNIWVEPKDTGGREEEEEEVAVQVEQ